MVGGEDSLKVLGHLLLQFGSDRALKIFWEEGESVTLIISDKGVCKKAPATLGLLKQACCAGCRRRPFTAEAPPIGKKHSLFMTESTIFNH